MVQQSGQIGDAAVAVRHDWGIDALQALPLGAIQAQTNGPWQAFREIRLPQIRDEIAKADARFQKLLQRRASLAAHKAKPL